MQHAPSSASPEDDQALASFEQRIGYAFKNRELLIESLTHASAAGGQQLVYERLEFLGDRVLGLLAADALLEKFPDSPEGDLAPRLNALVRKERCAAVAFDIGLPAVVRVSEAEARGRLPSGAILADVCEAVIAAIYLDGGLEAARTFFAAAWAEGLNEVIVLPRDPKSALQEWSQDRSLGLPDYTLASRAGPDHQPEFTVRVAVRGNGEIEGRGSSKRGAEQAAAAAFLVHLGAWTESDAKRALMVGQS